MVYENKIAELGLGYKGILLGIEELANEAVRDICKTSRYYGKRYSCPPHAPPISFFQKEFKNIFAYLIFVEGSDIQNWYFLSNLIL